MKIFVFLSLILILSVTPLVMIVRAEFTPKQCEAQLLCDPGLELSTPDGTFPDSGCWTVSCAGGTACPGAVCTTTSARTGHCGLWVYTGWEASACWTGPYQEFDSSEGEVYYASAWIRTPPISVIPEEDRPGWVNGSVALVRVMFLDLHRQQLALYDSDGVYTAETGWAKYEVTTNPAPQGTKYVRYILYLEKPQVKDAISIANFDDCYLEMQHTVTITNVSANPSTIDSGGTTSLSATATDACGHSVTYGWIVSPSEGSFDNPNKQNPIWTAPENCTGADKTYTFTVTATCSVNSNVKDTGTVQVTVKLEQRRATILEKVSGDNQSGYVGTILPAPLVVRALDQCNEPMSGVDVNFEPTEGASVNPTQEPTDINGEAKTILTLGTKPGDYNVTASVEGIVEPIVFTATAIDVKADIITLGNAEDLPNTEVRIPLYIRDVSETPLDADDAGNEIAAWSIQFATNENYEITDVERAGITESLEPGYEQFFKATNTWSVIYNTSAGKPPPKFTLDKPSPGDLVGNLVVNIADMTITEDLVVSVEMTQNTTLSNEGGTVGESVSDGTLQFVNGELTILAFICGDTNGNRIGPDFLDVVYLFNYVAGGGPEPQPMLAGNCNGINGVDFLDVVYLLNHVVGNGPEPICSEITTLVVVDSPPAEEGTPKDILTLDEITARAGETIRLPLYLQDVSGTPLDADDPGNEIATWMIVFSTNEKYEIMDVQKAGITENLEPAYGQFIKATNTWSLIYNTDAGNPPPTFTLNKPSPGDLIGELVIKLSDEAEGDLSVEISAATLSNEAGTVGEFLANNTLGVVPGTIHVELYGDVSGDDNITAYDASLVLQHVVGLTALSPEQQEAADVTGDGTISALDAALILQYTVGLITSFPVDSAPVAPALNPKTETQVLAEAIKQLESISLTKEQKKVLEQLKNLISKQLRPKHTVLLQNYPNPFNPETWLPYKLATDAPVTISIYNKKGQLVRKLHLGLKTAGNYFTKDKAAYWDGKDSLGEKVASGVYFYTLQAGEFRATQKMVIMK